MTNQVTFRIYTKEIKSGNQKFYVSSAKINDEWYKIKFTKDCDRAPKDRGIYDVTVDYDDCSIESGKLYTKDNGETGIAPDNIWIKKLIDIRRYTEDELREMNREKISKIFGV